MSPRGVAPRGGHFSARRGVSLPPTSRRARTRPSPRSRPTGAFGPRAPPARARVRSPSPPPLPHPSSSRLRAGSDAGRAPAPRTRLPPLAGGMSAINVTSVQVLVRPALVPPRTRLRGPLVRPPRRDPSEGRRSSSRERGPEARLPRSSPPRSDRRPTRARNRRPPPTSPPRRRITPSTS